MQIDWWTLAFQAVNFLVLVWLLQRFLFRPVRAVIARRRALADRAFAEAEEAKAEAAAEAERLRAAQQELARERQETVTRLHEEMRGEREEMLAAATREAEVAAEEARREIAEERRRALAGLKQEIAAAAADLTAMLLRGLEAPALGRAVLHRAERALAGLPEEELRRLRDDVAGRDEGITVVTAHRLEDALAEEWRRTLGRWFEPGTAIGFAVEPAILGGVELRFPHAALRYSWAEELARARTEMVGDDAA